MDLTLLCKGQVLMELPMGLPMGMLPVRLQPMGMVPAAPAPATRTWRMGRQAPLAEAHRHPSRKTPSLYKLKQCC